MPHISAAGVLKNTMLTSLQIKGLILTISLLVICGGVWYIKYLIGKNAVLEASLESTTSVLRDYALDVEENHQLQIELNDALQKQFNTARAESNELKKRLAENDIQTLLNDDPVGTELSINDSTLQLLFDLSEATGNPARTENSATTRP